MSFFAPLGTPEQLYVNNFADEEWGTMTGSVANYPFNGSAIDLLPDADGYSFISIDPKGIAMDGEEIVIANVSDTHSVNMPHDSASGAEGSRFFFPDNQSHALTPGMQIWGVRRENIAGRVGWWMEIPQ